jgi:hypothetical protein
LKTTAPLAFPLAWNYYLQEHPFLDLLPLQSFETFKYHLIPLNLPDQKPKNLQLKTFAPKRNNVP